MPHVITQNCCKDGSCVPVCPVDCIRPAPGEANYGAAELLYIDPEVCIDCGACVDECPVHAIFPDYELPTELAGYEQINADYYEAVGSSAGMGSPLQETSVPGRAAPDSATLRVAVVGAGAAGHYTAEALLAHPEVRVRVDLIERLCVPGGLVRYGVAPDHQDTKDVLDAFTGIRGHAAVTAHYNADIGTDLGADTLAQRYHAVVYAIGAVTGRRLDVPGEDLPGSAAAADFVAWFNGHPDFADRDFGFDHERAVVIGNGNVALDVARILAMPIEALARTDIAEHALAAARDSRIREVVVCGRRGPEHAAFTTPELLGLASVDGIDVIVDPADLDSVAPGPDDEDPAARFRRTQKLRVLQALADTPPTGGRRVVLRFHRGPTEILGGEFVTGVRLAPPGPVPADDGAGTGAGGEMLDCTLVLRAIGYRGTEIAGVPFDSARGVIPNDGGRVLGPDGVLAGLYVAGWIKRGPTGVIGSNRGCARETADAITQDFAAGRLPEVSDPDLGPESGLEALLPERVGDAGARALDEYEKRAGREAGRPRVKVVRREAMLEVARLARG